MYTHLGHGMQLISSMVDFSQAVFDAVTIKKNYVIGNMIIAVGCQKWPGNQAILLH